MVPLLLCRHPQRVRRQYLAGGYHGLFQRNMITVPLFHLGLDNGVGEVEVPESLQPSQMEAETTIIDLPDQLGTVHAGVGPLEGKIVWFALECCCSLLELRPGLRRKDSVGVRQTLDNVVSTFTPSPPLLQWSVLDGLERFVHVGLPITKEDDTHVAVFRMSRLLNGDAL